MTSHADNHDKDKLARWQRDLTSGSSVDFPAYAIFLVSVEDKYAHDVFRRFRSSFEERDAGFERLVIFGQHGVSTTVHGLLDRFGLKLESLPLLAILSNPANETLDTITLAPGEADVVDTKSGGQEVWQQVLDRVEAAAARDEKVLDLTDLSGVGSLGLGSPSLAELAEGILARLP